jgi:hypothetical protein
MPGFQFQDITIKVFDVHTTVNPHLPRASGYFLPAFACLKSPRAYNERYRAQAAIRTVSFSFGNLPQRVRRTHFWQAYLDGWDNPKIDYWKQQVPMLGRFRKLPVQHNFNLEGRITFSLKIYLSPLGWSTDLVIRLQGQLRNQQVIDLMACLTGHSSGPAAQALPFAIAGKPKNLTDVFIYCQDLLVNEVYGRTPHRPMYIPRHYVISLNRFKGSIVDFAGMAPADQATLFSLFFGRNYTANDVVKETVPKKLTTIISGPNFALTNYDHGTLLFPQRDAQDPAREAAVHCLANNVHDFLLQYFILFYFYKYSQDGSPRARVTTLRRAIQANLAGLQSRYSNQFCQNIFLNPPS